jgi:regulator of sigma E protease
VTNLWAFLFVLGVLVFVHELGHFLLARWNGVRVLTFSLGFGPKLLKVVRGGTEYCISAIPLGGYVKMAGETPDDPRQGAPDEFLSKTKWQRFQILIAGPLMNLLLAVGLMTFVIWNGATEPAYEQRTPVVGRVLPGSPAEKAGIRAGDVILAFADKDVTTWQGLQMRVVPRANREVPIVISRDGQRQQLTVVPEAQTKYEIGDLGISPSVHPEVVQVQPGSAAEAAGLKPKDVIVSFNGTDTTGFTLQQMIGEISKRAGQPVTLGVVRDGARIEVSATPRDQGGVGRLGINLSPFETVTTQPAELGVDGDDRRDARRAVHGRDVAQAAHGAARDRRSRRWRGLDRLGRPVRDDGDGEPEPGPAEPDADPDPRWRPHHHPGHRGPRPPRLQHARQGADADGRVRGADAVDGDGHLQRPQPRGMAESVAQA